MCSDKVGVGDERSSILPLYQVCNVIRIFTYSFDRSRDSLLQTEVSISTFRDNAPIRKNTCYHCLGEAPSGIREEAMLMGLTFDRRLVERVYSRLNGAVELQDLFFRPP